MLINVNKRFPYEYEDEDAAQLPEGFWNEVERVIQAASIDERGDNIMDKHIVSVGIISYKDYKRRTLAILPAGRIIQRTRSLEEPDVL